MVKHKPEDRVSLNEAVKYLMKETGRTRRQAERMLIHAIKSGEVRVEGIPVGGDMPEEIPLEAFRSIPTEH